MLQDAKDIGLTCFYALVASFWTLTGMYAEQYLGASAGQVLFMGSIAALVSLLAYVGSVKTARNIFYEHTLVFCSLFGYRRDGYNYDELKVRILESFDEDITLKEYFGAMWARSIIGNIALSLLLLAVSIISSVANCNAIYRIIQLLTGIFVSWIFIKQEKVSLFTLLVIVPLSIIGILLVVQPGFIFDYILNDDDGDNGVSYIGVILLIMAAVIRMMGNLIIKKFKHIPWYMIGFTVAVGGILVGFIDICVEYWYSNDTSIWNNLIFANSDESIGVLIGYNCVVFLWGFQDFFVTFLLTHLYQNANFVVVTLIGTVVRTLFVYLLEYLIFATSLNGWTYLGMTIMIAVTLLYNGQTIYQNKKKQQQQEQQFSQSGHSNAIYYSPIISTEIDDIDGKVDRALSVDSALHVVKKDIHVKFHQSSL